MLNATLPSGIRFLSQSKGIMKYITKSLGSVDIVWPEIGKSSCVDIEGGGALCRDQLAANFNPKTFSRESTQDIEMQINYIWTKKSANNSRLYNGTKFRFSDGTINEQKYVLNVGLTTYKELCGTNLAKNFSDLQEKGRNEFGHSQALMSDPIGVGILLITEDGFLVVTRRASWTGEFPGMLDRPGGHPEPERILTPEATLKPELAEADINKVVIDEIWTSAAQEAEDELGVSRENLEGMKFLGLSINNESGGRPSLEFIARLCMKSKDVRSVYNQGRQAEADESTALHLIPNQVFRELPTLLLKDIKPDKQTKDGNKSSKSANKSSSKYEEETSNIRDEMSTFKKEAQSLLEEATPALKAAIMLAHYHHLLKE